MKVVIKDSDHRFPIVFYFPTGLVLNRLTAYLAPTVLKNSDITLTRQQALRFVKELKRCKKRFNGWKIVEVVSADGERVEVKL